jgi:sugar lactone lactonase YvrE
LVPDSFAVVALALDDTDVYFMSFASLARVSKAGGSPSPVTQGEFFPPLALDATHLYTFHNADRRLIKIHKVGATSVDLGPPESGSPQGLTVVGGYAYWVVYPGGLRRVAVAGGSVETLSGPTDYPVGLAVDGSHAYFSSLMGQSISRVPIGGGTAETLATGLLAPNHLAVEGETLYYGDVNTIQAIPKQGGEIRVVTDALPSNLAVDDTHVYWGSSTARHVARAPLSGGTAELVAKDLNTPNSLALDDTHVYFVDESAVYVAPKGCCVSQP